MNIVNKKLSLKEFEDYVSRKDFGKYPPTFLVIHHTYSPIEDDHDGKLETGEWNGQSTINGLKKYYENKGWSAGPHLFIADDGIWLFTDMYDVGIHAGDGNGSFKTGYSIGIEIVGNYDNKLWDEETYVNAMGAIKFLMARLNIKENMIKFHRDYSSKSCPGWAITKEWVINNLKKDIMEKDFIKSIEKLTGSKYGNNINSKEQLNIAKKIKEIILEINKKDDKLAEYSKIINENVSFMNEQAKEIGELKMVKDKGVEALGVIKLLQEAFKQLINFK